MTTHINSTQFMQTVNDMILSRVGLTPDEVRSMCERYGYAPPPELPPPAAETEQVLAVLRDEPAKRFRRPSGRRMERIHEPEAGA